MTEPRQVSVDQSPALEGAAQPLARRAADFHHAVSHLVRVWLLRERNRAGSHNLSSSAAYALEVLVQKGTLGVNDLAAEIFVERSTASRVVAGMEEKGYVRRQLDPKDRRSVRIEVTELGLKTYQEIHRDSVRDAAQLLESTAADPSGGLTRQLQEIARASAGDAPW